MGSSMTVSIIEEYDSAVVSYISRTASVVDMPDGSFAIGTV